jgi:NADH-ubiquinone oxidoreductase chain 5
MEGPTPVSALLHAATMVTAGVFLIIRLSPMFEFLPFILIIMSFVGSLTAFLGASIGMLQNDIKKIIAYSTCSQLGYMIFSCGISNYSGSFFHLINHAFFKALLFLSAGAIIHALYDEQDIRKMGNLAQIQPFIYVSFLIGSLALIGFPFLSGFYSKDFILESSITTYNINGHSIF